MTNEKVTAEAINTSAQPADRAAIAAILADAHDDPMCNKAVRIAHEVLRQVRGAAFDGEPFMLTGLARIGDAEYVACTCFYHTVLILEDWAFVYTAEEGGMVPWMDGPKVCMPRMDYFDCRVAIDPSVRPALLPYVHELIEKHQDGPSALVDDDAALSAPSM
jgi:hypothetical protein